MKAVFLYDPKVTGQGLINTFKSFTSVSEKMSECDFLIRWGNINGPDEKARLVLNRKNPLKNSLDKEKCLEIFRINKIRRPRFVYPRPDSTYPLVAKYFHSNHNSQKVRTVANFSEAVRSGADFFVENIALIKKYHVYVFDLNVFLLTKKIPVKSNAAHNQAAWEYDEVPDTFDQDAQKVCQLAQRAVYVVGLDFAMVHAGIDVRGRPIILDITPTPQLNPAARKLFYARIKDYAQSNLSRLNAAKNSEQQNASLDAPRQLTIFSDEPKSDEEKSENELKSEGNEVPEEEICRVLIGADPEFMLRDSLTGKIVYPSAFVGREGPLGYDERSEQRQGLLFPLAEVRPQPQYCPLQLAEEIRKVLGDASKIFPPNVEWLAGSLQFEQYQIGGHIHFSNIILNSRLLRALDNYLGIPVFLMENPDTASKRRRQYGWIGSVRLKSHGGFEYRTPGSWLVSPEITTGCLCLAKLVATEYKYLLKDFFIDPEIQKAFYQAKKMYFYEIFNDLWDDIMKTCLYNEYKEYLLPINQLIRSGAHWNEDTDFRIAWELLKPVVT